MQVNWRCLTFVQPYGVKALRRSSEKNAYEKKYVRANQATFITKTLSKEIMKRSRLRNKLLNTKSDTDRKEYKKQRNYVVSLR